MRPLKRRKMKSSAFMILFSCDQVHPEKVIRDLQGYGELTSVLPLSSASDKDLMDLWYGPDKTTLRKELGIERMGIYLISMPQKSAKKIYKKLKKKHFKGKNDILSIWEAVEY